ncbi:MAG: indole-3-glycerol-phosphate synthase TrpC, partial [Candidatus Omnitrophica bacterium]|nr:indole-3-glycerol-phosphate synthase TrpC [Candidatus Omnitrophota bacterium]
ADAILLIARILTKDQIKSFMHLAATIGMDSVVEVHDDIDLEKAIVAGAGIIGINNRDLGTLKVDSENALRLTSRIPNEVIKISESGIRNNADIAALKQKGINAVLVGTTFLEASDIGAKVREVMGEDVVS